MPHRDEEVTLARDGDAETLLSTVFQRQLSTQRTMPDTVLRGIWALASRNHDVATLAELAGRDDLPNDLVEAAGSSPKIALRVAYLCRRATSDDTIVELLGSENRAGVISAVISAERVTASETLPARLHAVVRLRLAERPTKTLAEAVLLLGTSVPLDIRVDAAHALLKTGGPVATNTKTSLEELLRELRTQPDVLSGLVVTGSATLDLHVLRSMFAVPGLGTDARVALLDRMFASAAAGSQLSVRGALGAVDSMLGLDDVQREVLDRAESLGQRLSTASAELMKDFIDKLRSYSPSERSKLAEQRRSMLSAASSSTDSEWLAQLCVESRSDRELAEALLENSEISSEAAELVTYAGPEAAARRIRRVRDDSSALAAYLAHGTAIVRLDAWQAFADPVRAQKAVVGAFGEQCAAQGVVGHSPATRRVLELIDMGVCDEALAELPWKFVTGVCTYGPYYTNRAGIRQLLQVVTDSQRTLGEDAAKWEAYVALAGDFSGTVGQLATVARSL